MENMLKQIVPIIVVGLLIIGRSSAVVMSKNENSDANALFETTEIFVSEPTIKEKGGYVSVELTEATSMLMLTGKPILPVITKTFTFPVGTKIVDVDVSSVMNEYLLSGKVQPAPMPVILSIDPIMETSEDISPDVSLYSSSDPYPSETYTIRKGIGLKDGEHVLYLNIDCYTQYIATQDVMYVPEKIEIDIQYEEPETSILANDVYDMLIITDEKFAEGLQPLVDHKNSIGIRTVLETTQEIYPNYDGRDDAEDIKLRIADAIEDLGINYVLLAGGRKGQTDEWYIPERVVTNDDNSNYETGYASDLYYADVFKIDQSGHPHFEDWDPNGNSKFAECYNRRPIEFLDYYPDVQVGRIPFRYSWETDIAVNKIITYENTADDSWFKKGVTLGGDTSPPARGDVEPGIYEGEIATDVTASYLISDGFEVTKLWTSDGTFSCSEDVQNAVSPGCGWVHFAGHANPSLLGNFLPDAETEEDFVYGVTFLDIAKGAYSNGNKLPVMVIGGCHTCQFNVSMQQLLTEEIYRKLGRSEWIPTDFSSWLLLNDGGGAIATLGPTGLGYGYVNRYVTQGLGGWLNPRFAHAFVVQQIDILGDVWGQAITDYINKLGSAIDGVNVDGIDRKIVEETILLGDPSLKIGGLHRAALGGNEDNEESSDNPESMVASVPVDAPIWDIGTEWTYKLNNIDITLSETEGRYIDFHLSSGNIKLKVVQKVGNSYRTEFITDDLDVSVDVDFDFYMEDKEPMALKLTFEDATLNGTIYFDQATLGIEKIDAKLSIVFDTSSLPIELPEILVKLIPTIPVEVNIEAVFDQPYILLDFPLSTDSEWGLPAGNITIDGTVESVWLRILNIVNKIAKIIGKDFIPPELEQFLPVIDLSEVLESYDFPTTMEIPEVTKSFRKAPFICSDQKTISVEAGTFDAYKITALSGMGDIYYSPEVKNIVKITGYLGNFIPYLEDIDIELVSVSS